MDGQRFVVSDVLWRQLAPQQPDKAQNKDARAPSQSPSYARANISFLHKGRTAAFSRVCEGIGPDRQKQPFKP